MHFNCSEIVLKCILNAPKSYSNLSQIYKVISSFTIEVYKTHTYKSFYYLCAPIN